MMRNKKILVFIGILLVSCIFLVGGIIKKMQHKENVAAFVGELKQLQYIDIQNNVLKNVKSNGNYNLLVFFNSECGHCQAEAKLLQTHSSEFKGTNVYFLSTESKEAIQKFSSRYKLQKYHIGQVDAEKVALQMGVNTFPMLFVYAPDGHLLKAFKGEIKLEAILNYLQ